MAKNEKLPKEKDLSRGITFSWMDRVLIKDSKEETETVPDYKSISLTSITLGFRFGRQVPFYGMQRVSV